MKPPVEGMRPVGEVTDVEKSVDLALFGCAGFYTDDEGVTWYVSPKTLFKMKLEDDEEKSVVAP